MMNFDYFFTRPLNVMVVHILLVIPTVYLIGGISCTGRGLFASGVILLMLHSKRVSSKNMRWPKLEQFSEKCSNFGHQIVIANISKSYRPMQFLFSQSDKESFQLPNKYWIKLKRLITSYGQFFKCKKVARWPKLHPHTILATR